MGQAGPVSTGNAKVSARQCSTNCAIQLACLATNTSRLRRPASISSRACSQIAVMLGSAMAAGTASIRVWAAAEAIKARFFFSKYPRSIKPLMMPARVASVPIPVVSRSFCFRRGSLTSLATFFIALIRSPSVSGLGAVVRIDLSSTSFTAHCIPCCKTGKTWNF
ncbi:hypothetical protein D3C87_1379740 [compost metagenome]